MQLSQLVSPMRKLTLNLFQTIALVTLLHKIWAIHPLRELYLRKFLEIKYKFVNDYLAQFGCKKTIETKSILCQIIRWLFEWSAYSNAPPI